MTHKEMTEIFAVLLLAYPNAEIFKGGIKKLAPTINLWVTCLPDVDFGQASRLWSSCAGSASFLPP